MHLWCKDDIHAALSTEQFAVSLQIPGIRPVIFILAKLGRIDKYRHRYMGGFFPSPANQREMPFMQRSHGRHQRTGLTCPVRLIDPSAHILNAAQYLHGYSWPAWSPDLCLDFPKYRFRARL